MKMISCPNCGNDYLEVIETDSRQEWTDETLGCESCNKFYEKTTVYNEVGLIVNETLEEVI